LKRLADAARFFAPRDDPEAFQVSKRDLLGTPLRTHGTIAGIDRELAAREAFGT
jgi:hypothetical protein